MNTNTLLLELFVEELPPKSLKKLGEAFASLLAEGLKSQGLAAADALVTAFASPRRLAVQVGGVAALVNTVMAQRGKSAGPYTPDVQHSSSRKQSLDAALREAIEEGVRLLAERFAP